MVRKFRPGASRGDDEKGDLDRPRRQLPSNVKTTTSRQNSSSSGRPISSLLSQLESFNVEMSPTFDATSSAPSPGSELAPSAAGDESNGADFDLESDQILADIAKLLPSRRERNQSLPDLSVPRIAVGGDRSLGQSARSRRPTRNDSSSPRNLQVTLPYSTRGETRGEAPTRQESFDNGVNGRTYENRTATSPRSPVSSGPNTGDDWLKCLSSLHLANPFEDNTPENGDSRSFTGKQYHRKQNETLSDTADSMLMDLMVQQATMDTAFFKSLKSEVYQQQKSEMKALLEQITQLQSRLTMKAKVRETASSLARLDTRDARQSVRAQEQFSNASRELSAIFTDLWSKILLFWNIERAVLKHLGATLRLKAMQPTSDVSRTPGEENSFAQASSSGKSGKVAGEGREQVVALQNQVSLTSKRVEKNLEILEKKDRLIAELRTEIEELQNQVLMNDATGASKAYVGTNRYQDGDNSADYSIRDQANSSNINAELRDRLKQVVKEMEKTKIALRQEKSIANELRGDVERLQRGEKERDGSDTESDEGSGTMGANRYRSRETNTKPNVDSRSGYKSFLESEDYTKLQTLYTDYRRSPRATSPTASRNPTLSNFIDFLVVELPSLLSKSRPSENISAVSANAKTREMEDLETRLRAEYDSTISELKTELEVARDQETSLVTTLENDLADHRAKNLDLEDRILQESRAADAKVAALEKDLADHRAENLDLEDRILQESRAADAKVAELEAQIDDYQGLQSRLEQLQAENSDLKDQITALESEVFETSQEAVKKHRKELSALRDQHREELDALNDENVSLRRERNLMQRKGSGDGNATDSIASLSNGDLNSPETPASRAETRDLKATLTETRAKLEDSEQKLVLMKSQFFQEREQLLEQLDRLQQELAEQRSKNSDVQSSGLQELNLKSSELEKAEATIEDLRARCDELTKDSDTTVKSLQTKYNEALEENSKLRAMEARLEVELQEKKQIESELNLLRSQDEENRKQLQEALLIAQEIKDIQDLVESKESEIQAARNEAASALQEAAKITEEMKELRAQTEQKEKEFKEGQELVETMQRMVMELKTGKGDMLDEMEDCRYREELAKRRATVLETELSKLTELHTGSQADISRHLATIEQLELDLRNLRSKLSDLQVETIGKNSGDEAPDVTAMRAEFRKVVTKMRQEQESLLASETSARQSLESEIRKLRRQLA
ncbi:hypothetical protein DFS34DRAFT_192801 [Phlyctochytrium arcticum]|nr:hypothetical protein DFS34DRAFT_192801 [Phlyctochytrium arcticum]